TGNSVDEIVALLEKHPNGIAAKYDGRLRKEIERCYEKWQQQKANSTTTPHDWSDPDLSILDDRRGDLPDFPIEVLSPLWQAWAAREARGAGVTVAHVFVPLLAIASSLVGTARRIRPSRSWSEPLTMWTAIVGFSGSGKTLGLNVIKRALNKIEKDR